MMTFADLKRLLNSPKTIKAEKPFSIISIPSMIFTKGVHSKLVGLLGFQNLTSDINKEKARNQMLIKGDLSVIPEIFK